MMGLKITKDGHNLNKRLLIVDDEENMQLMYKKVLSRNGIKVDAVNSVMSALDMIQKTNYDLMIVDISITSMDGLELLVKLQDRRPVIPSIMITGFPSIYAARRCRELGALDYLTKPIEIKELNAVVNNALFSASA